MKTVWKYQAHSNPFAYDLPAGARVVHFDMQGDVPTMWIHVDTEAKLERRAFLVAGTGHDLPDGAQHLGSCIARELGLVWHLFEPVESPSRER